MKGQALLIVELLILGLVSLVFLAGCAAGPSQAPNNQLAPSGVTTNNQLAPTGVTVTPFSATVEVDGAQQFIAAVIPNAASQGITWSVTGTGCTGAACGVIDATGRYTAPATVPNPPTVTITARSVADPTKGTIAAVTIIIALSVNPLSVDFGTQRINTTSAPRTVTVTNTSSAAEPVSARMNGFNFADFTQTNNCPQVLPAGASCTFNVTFTPSGAGNRIGILFIDGRSKEEGVVNLNGSGMAGSPSGCTPSSGTQPPMMAPDAVAIAPDPSGNRGKFAYVVNRYAHCVSMYAINSTTGALNSVGTIAAGAYPVSVAVHPSGKFVYVVNVGSSDVYTYTIDPATGALTFTGTIAAESGAVRITVDPSGSFAYVANGISVSMYTIDPNTGALTSIGATAAGPGAFSLSVAVDPSGRFVYVARPADTVGVAIGYVSTYMIEATSGALTTTGSVTAGVDPFSVAVDPSDKFAYVGNVESGDISMYSVNSTTGVLTPIGATTTSIAPISVAVHPSGKFLYAADLNSGISIYALDASTGVLTSIGAAATESSPSWIAIDPSGKFAYVTNFGSDSVSMYDIDIATRALTLIGTIST